MLSGEPRVSTMGDLTDLVKTLGVGGALEGSIRLSTTLQGEPPGNTMSLVLVCDAGFLFASLDLVSNRVTLVLVTGTLCFDLPLLGGASSKVFVNVAALHGAPLPLAMGCELLTAGLGGVLFTFVFWVKPFDAILPLMACVLELDLRGVLLDIEFLTGDFKGDFLDTLLSVMDFFPVVILESFWGMGLLDLTGVLAVELLETVLAAGLLVHVLGVEPLAFVLE